VPQRKFGPLGSELAHLQGKRPPDPPTEAHGYRGSRPRGTRGQSTRRAPSYASRPQSPRRDSRSSGDGVGPRVMRRFSALSPAAASLIDEHRRSRLVRAAPRPRARQSRPASLASSGATRSKYSRASFFALVVDLVSNENPVFGSTFPADDLIPLLERLQVAADLFAERLKHGLWITRLGDPISAAYRKTHRRPGGTKAESAAAATASSAKQSRPAAGYRRTLPWRAATDAAHAGPHPGGPAARARRNASCSR
jgi:hypothetical protein